MFKLILVAVLVIWVLCTICSGPNIDHWNENED